MFRLALFVAAVSARYCAPPSKKSFLQQGSKMVPFDGYFEIGCFIDNTPESEWKVYKGQEKLTPQVCFNFCRATPGMKFFGLVYGTTCYCTPYPTLSAGAGGKGSCTSPCPGNNNLFCGDNKGKASVYEMHRCGDMNAEAQKEHDAAADLVANVTKLVSTAEIALSAVTAVAEKVDVTATRQLIMGEMKELNELIHLTNAAKEKVAEPLKTLDSAIKAFSPDKPDDKSMVAIEQAEGIVAATAAKLKSLGDKLQAHWAGHSLVISMKFHGISAEAVDKKVNAASELHRDFGRLPAAVEKGIDDKGHEVKGYFSVGEHLNSLYFTSSSGATREKALQYCYETCIVTPGCVAANIFGQQSADGEGYTCNLKKTVKQVQLLKSVQKGMTIQGFIFNTYFGLHAKDIEFNTANLI